MTRWIIGYAVLTLLMLPAVAPAHADVWVLDTRISPLNGHTYHLVSPSPWTDAEILAISLGGHLATINDGAENDWVWETFAADRNRLLWIGLNDVVREGTFTWISGEPVAFLDWNPDQPTSTIWPGDETADLEDYVQMGYSVSWKWNDMANKSEHNGVPLHGVVEVIPEPSTLMLLSVGALAVAGYIWRRRRAG